MAKLERLRVPLSTLDYYRLTTEGQALAQRTLATCRRIRNVRARVAVMKDAVRGYYAAEALKAQQAIHPGIVLRGWWYPRALVLGLAWMVAAGLFGALVVGLFRLFGGAA
jgi:hypothetical protein